MQAAEHRDTQRETKKEGINLSLHLQSSLRAAITELNSLVCARRKVKLHGSNGPSWPYVPTKNTAQWMVGHLLYSLRWEPVPEVCQSNRYLYQ